MNDRLKFRNRLWNNASCPKPALTVTAIVLAGGRSQRMGHDKASLIVGGRTLLQRTVDTVGVAADEIVIVQAPGQQLPQIVTQLPIRCVEDTVERQGPLVGIATGLRAAVAPVSLVVACDMPFLRVPLLKFLVSRAQAGSRLVVPIFKERPQPLCSAFRSESLIIIEKHIDAGIRDVMSISSDLNTEFVEPSRWMDADPDGRSFENVNTPEEFKAALDREQADIDHEMLCQQ